MIDQPCSSCTVFTLTLDLGEQNLCDHCINQLFAANRKILARKEDFR